MCEESGWWCQWLWYDSVGRSSVGISVYSAYILTRLRSNEVKPVKLLTWIHQSSFCPVMSLSYFYHIIGQNIIKDYGSLSLINFKVFKCKYIRGLKISKNLFGTHSTQPFWQSSFHCGIFAFTLFSDYNFYFILLFVKGFTHHHPSPILGRIQFIFHEITSVNGLNFQMKQ